MATNVVRKGLNRQWQYFRGLSRSADELNRTSALAHAVSSLEIGLGALGVASDRKSKRDKRGVQARLKDAITQFSLGHLPPTTKIESAFQARNSAVHQHKVVPVKVCQQHISTFHQIWNSMRSQFVTREHAGHLAASMLKMKEISDVYLFGSLARRNRKQPRDIDLLLLDEGDFSAFGASYGRTDLAALEEYFDALNPFVIRSGWLDLIIIDGIRFGTDPDYTIGVASQHWDSLFFLNIADGLLKYNQSSGKWTSDIAEVFRCLAELRKQIENQLIVPPQTRKGRRGHNSRRGTKAFKPTAR